MIDIPSDDVVFNPEPKLLPCPFCGYTPKIEHKTLYGDSDGNYERPLESYRAHCPTCGVSGQWWSTIDLAANRWNMRAG